jgi:hypothetical protein
VERVTLNASQFDSGDSSFNSSILFRTFHESWMQIRNGSKRPSMLKSNQEAGWIRNPTNDSGPEGWEEKMKLSSDC